MDIHHDHPMTETPTTTEPRRGFFASLAALALAAFGLAVPALTAVAAYVNPLRRKSAAGRFIRVASLTALPSDGTPRKFPVIADRVDAWNRYPNEPIGAIFLCRTESDAVEAYHVVCPHAGCSIVFQQSDDGGKFVCPCHVASFDLQGKRLDKTSPSPRDMDTLEVEIRGKAEVWVRFENYITGITDKIAEA